jgi:hypothetical protein
MTSGTSSTSGISLTSDASETSETSDNSETFVASGVSDISGTSGTLGASVIPGTSDVSGVSGTSSDTVTLDRERADLLTMLAGARYFLRYTTRDLTDEQARQRTTVSELTLGGLIKHVTAVERNWASFIVHGPSVAPDFSKPTEADYQAWAEGFRLLPGENLAGALAEYEDVAKHTDELVATLPDLDDIIRESLDGAKSMG